MLHNQSHYWGALSKFQSHPTVFWTQHPVGILKFAQRFNQYNVFEIGSYWSNSIGKSISTSKPYQPPNSSTQTQAAPDYSSHKAETTSNNFLRGLPFNMCPWLPHLTVELFGNFPVDVVSKIWAEDTSLMEVGARVWVECPVTGWTTGTIKNFLVGYSRYLCRFTLSELWAREWVPKCKKL